MTSESELRDLIEKDEAQRRERIALALERGGLPTERELEELDEHLDESYSCAEALAMNVKHISESDDGSELPSPITFEQLGIVAMIADDLETRAKELVRFAEQIRERLYHLDMIRREQAPEKVVRDA